MKKFKNWYKVLAIAVSLLAVLSHPKVRSEMFVALHGDTLEQHYIHNEGIPVGLPYRIFNRWESQHDMLEYILVIYGQTYTGCYYSPDDVPLPFQNADVALTQDGENRWVWTGEGDNHGSTEKIRDYWYYFEASF